MSMTSNASPAKSAAEIDAAAADWLTTRYDSGAWSEENQAALETWFAEDIAHEIAFLRLEAAWERANRLTALKFELTEAQPKSRSTQWKALFGSVAALIALGAGAFEYLSRPHIQTYATDIGGRKTVTLADGSHIELNTDTHIRAEIARDSATLWLDKGEAYFEIKHDPSRKFVVIASGRTITDLGTKFRVKSQADHVQVALLEGRVSVESSDAAGKPQKAVLQPGDVAIGYSHSLSVISESRKDLEDDLSWRKGTVVFDNVSLADAVADLNRYNTKHIVIPDPAVARRRIAGTFRTDDVQGFAALAQDLLKLRVDNRKDAIVISR
jgi:transmembrane sensor